MTVKRVIGPDNRRGTKTIKIWTDEIEASAEQQLRALSELPFIHKHVAVMPDVHAGIGSTVGSVIPTIKAIVPAAVGVDIGCGMMAHRLNLTASDLPELHSGSRGIGNRIGTYFIEQAKREMERWSIKLADPNLAYLPEHTDLFQDYWQAVSWAQDYARVNRELMMLGALGAVAVTLKRPVAVNEFAVNCHHNYVAIENHYGQNVYVTRKGAVRARQGDLGIIPGSMGARSFIVRGKGNPESFCSCSHGAGRKMSRTEAARRFTADDLAAQTAGVECRKDAGGRG